MGRGTVKLVKMEKGKLSLLLNKTNSDSLFNRGRKL